MVAKMKKFSFDPLFWFCLIVEEGNLTKAAARLGVSVPTLSRQLATLETKIGHQLLHRNARQLNLTNVGETYYNTLAPSLALLQEQVAQLQDSEHDLSGRIHLTCPETAFTTYVNEWVCAFLKAHPKIQMSISFDISEHAFETQQSDLAIVIRPPTKSTLTQIRVLEQEMCLTAAPEYLDQNGKPETLDNLDQFDCLTLGGNDIWPFVQTGSADVPTPTSRYATHSMSALIEASVSGLGICYCPKFLVQPHIATGRLIRILPHIRLPDRNIYLVYGNPKLMPARVRKLRDHLIEQARSFDRGPKSRYLKKPNSSD
jgi:LysR family transcriptional regulator AphB